MVSDRPENEPDEYDPEAEFRDPDSDSITIPQVPTENAGSDLRSDLRSELEEDKIAAPELSTSETDVDSEVLKNFWALVLVVNAAVLAFALGLLFLIFEGEVAYSAYLLAAGLVFTGFGIRRYRSFERANDDASTTNERDLDPGDRAAEPDDETLEDAETRNSSDTDTGSK